MSMAAIEKHLGNFSKVRINANETNKGHSIETTLGSLV